MNLQKITGLIGRDELVKKVLKEIRMKRHIVLTGKIGAGKSAILEAVARSVERRADERRQLDPIASDIELSTTDQRQQGAHEGQERRQARQLTMIYLWDHQTKGQFITIARRLLAVGILPPEALDLPEKYHDMEPHLIPWAKIKRNVTRLSIRDLSKAIIPAIHAHEGRIIIFVDDITSLTPTMQAFWLAIMDKAQVIAAANEKRRNLAKMWWQMKEIEVPSLDPEVSRELVQDYIRKQGVMIEAPDLYTAHLVKQSGGNPQALADMLTDSAKERVVDKRKIREMRHAAGIKYVDFTPFMVVGVASIIGTRYLAIGLGDRALYIFAGMLAALVLSARVFLFRGAGKAS